MDWGAIGTLPEIVGVALHKSGHVGYYVGNGYAVEWRGFAYGCVKTKVAGRGWTNWYKLPFIKYNDAASTVPDVDKPDGTPDVKPDAKPDTVRNLSYKPVMMRGEDVPDVDGDDGTPLDGDERAIAEGVGADYSRVADNSAEWDDEEPSEDAWELTGRS